MFERPRGGGEGCPLSLPTLPGSESRAAVSPPLPFPAGAPCVLLSPTESRSGFFSVRC